MQYIIGPTGIIILGGIISIVASVIATWKEKSDSSLRKLSVIAAIGGLLAIGGGVFSGFQQKNSNEISARQDIIRMDLRLTPYLQEYQRQIELMHGLYNDNRQIEEGFDFAAVGEILHNISYQDELGGFGRVNLFDLYFESQEKVHDAIEQSLLKIDRSRFQELADLLEERLRAIEETNPENMHVQITRDSKEKTEIIRDAKRDTVIVRQLQIEAHNIAGADKPNILIPYVKLYHLINKSIVFQKKYNAMLTKIRNDNR